MDWLTSQQAQKAELASQHQAEQAEATVKVLAEKIEAIQLKHGNDTKQLIQQKVCQECLQESQIQLPGYSSMQILAQSHSLWTFLTQIRGSSEIHSTLGNKIKCTIICAQVFHMLRFNSHTCFWMHPTSQWYRLRKLGEEKAADLKSQPEIALRLADNWLNQNQ